MSLMRHILNPWLRAVEKRRLRNGTPAQIRRALEMQSRMLFRGPRGLKQVWCTYGEVSCLEVLPKNAAHDRVLFYIHGGGFVFGSPNSHSALAAQLARRIGARSVLPRYRLAPEHPFPAAPDDVRAAWDGLIESGVDPKNIALGGDSAGGALAFGLVATLSAEGRAGPGIVFGFSPLTDLMYREESFNSNAEKGVLLPTNSAGKLVDMFLGVQSREHPSVSPLYGEFNEPPPAWMAVGDTEILRDDALRLAERLKAAGCDASLVVEHDLPHVWPLFHNILPEARSTLDALAVWIRQQQNWEV